MDFEALPVGFRIVLPYPPALEFSDKEFICLCRYNEPWRIEQAATGDLVFMPPTSTATGFGNAALTALFYFWSQQDGMGLVADSDTMFRLPNGAKRSPDVSWVLRSRWEALTAKQRKGFARLCPDFVLELRSPSDRMGPLKKKMEEYRANGARLGWLIDPARQEVFIYRAAGKAPERLVDPATVSGEDVLPGFTLEMARLWRALG